MIATDRLLSVRPALPEVSGHDRIKSYNIAILGTPTTGRSRGNRLQKCLRRWEEQTCLCRRLLVIMCHKIVACLTSHSNTHRGTLTLYSYLGWGDMMMDQVRQPRPALYLGAYRQAGQWPLGTTILRSIKRLLLLLQIMSGGTSEITPADLTECPLASLRAATSTVALWAVLRALKRSYYGS